MDVYTQVNKYSGVTDASPHRLVEMLLEGALEKLAKAKYFLKRGELVTKGETIGQAIAIIGGLQSGLNIDAGGELAENLDRLYDYMARRLLQANMENDENIIDEVSSLLKEIKTGWDAIPAEIRNK
ncbi:MAG: flagellar export chaperone FliS [Gammaproteobacteria bacterium]|nr:flagellar export chaperone FliS [Gammaproteobacteria bacterium]